MKRTIFVVCIVAAANLTAFSQLSSRIPRPKLNQSSEASSPAAVPVSPGLPRETSEQPVSSSQTYKPAIEYQNLMELRFYENQGGFMVENLEVIFPPQGRKASFVISRANGQVVNTVPLRLETPLAKYDMFGMFQPDGSGAASIGEPGDYVLSVNIDGQPITVLPFTMKRESNNDPFNPTTSFVREGPWRDLAHLSVRTDQPDSHIEFSWWTSLRELPPGTKSPMVTLHVMYGGQEIAATRSAVVPTQKDWQFFRHEFHFPTEKEVRWMTMADLTKKDGEYTVVAKVNGTPFKSYKAEVKGGQLQRHPRNQMDVEPHTAFISPRQVTSNYSMRDLYWIKKN